MQVPFEEERDPLWFHVAALLISVAGVVTAFLPIALNTSPWDAIRLRVPGNEGNWWHVLIGVPYLLGFPMTWVCLHSLFSRQPLALFGRRLIWIIVVLSICGTLLVTAPCLLRLGIFGRMNAWRWLSIIVPTFGILIAGGALLFLTRHRILPNHASLVGLNTAYLAHAAFCLVIYAPMPGTARSKSGWIVTTVIVWPMLLELLWIFVRSLRRPAMAKGFSSSP